MKENSTSALPAASFLVDIGKAGFSTGECEFFKISQIFLKTQKGLFLNSEKEHQVLLPLSALAGLTRLVIPLRVQRDNGTHPGLSSGQRLRLAQGRRRHPGTGGRSWLWPRTGRS